MHSVDDPELEALAARFGRQEIPHAEWTHAAHLSMGLWHVTRFGAEAALTRLRDGIRRLNDAHGTPNTLERGYHETVTVAYVRLIDAFVQACPPSLSPVERRRRLIEGPLGRRELLFDYWTRATLFSPAARSGWVEPDLRPLALPDAVR
jgi:hypothetical protein